MAEAGTEPHPGQDDPSGGVAVLPPPTPEISAPAGLLYYAVYLPHPGAPPGSHVGPPIYLPAPQGAAAPPAFAYAPPPAVPAATAAAQAHNQRLLVGIIIAVVALVHLPWLLYLFAVHGCWGDFIEMCGSASDGETDAFFETPLLFARVSYFVLRVQSVAMADWAQFSNVLQLSTGLGSFMLTKIVAANGLVAQGPRARILLAATCATAFIVLFWAEMHLTGDTLYPELADETILSYIDQMMPPEFPTYSDIRATLMQYLQFLRLADALILGAALAMSSAPKKT